MCPPVLLAFAASAELPCCGDARGASTLTPVATGTPMLSTHGDDLSTLPVVLDAASVNCITCHEDAVDAPTPYAGCAARNHPVGASYARDNALGSLRPRRELPPAIQLPAGRVSCLSCHQESEQRHGDLVLETAGSGLCLTCHDL